jgi:hypothetical protein
MSAHRNVTMGIRGVKLLIEVLPRSEAHPEQTPRRWCARLACPKDAVDEILDAGVLAEIDRNIRGGKYDEERDDGIPFDVPTGRVGA